MGSGVATYVAANRDIEKLILITPFDSIQAVAQEKFPIYPMQLMLFDKYDSIARARDIKAQTLFLIAEDDTLVPNENSLKLYDAFAPQKVQKEIFKGYNHNNIQLAPLYYKKMQQFLDAHRFNARSKPIHTPNGDVGSERKLHAKNRFQEIGKIRYNTPRVNFHTSGYLMTKEEILQTLSAHKHTLQTKYEVDKIGLFGSYAKGVATDESDIDIYVEFKHKTFRNIAGLWVYLEELYRKKIDLLYKHKNAKGAIFESIQKEVIYE